MNKKEQKAFDELKEQLRIAKAFRFTEPVPRDVPPPGLLVSTGELSKGWDFNLHRWTSGSMRHYAVEKACSSSISHSFGDDRKTSSQGAKSLYSTKLRALMALRHAVEMEYAKSLADLDAMIEQEKGGAT